jgi:hypothetical protein
MPRGVRSVMVMAWLKYEAALTVYTNKTHVQYEAGTCCSGAIHPESEEDIVADLHCLSQILTSRTEEEEAVRTKEPSTCSRPCL